ncbi:MAG: tetratricopeptide repeat protein, partial [Rhodoferax sp.]|nr:tetratricopeptide repeat protein [Rhodoferax sp.]
LRDLGVGDVVQATRLTDARRQLENRKFDVVLCEQNFSGDSMTGQDLLDDLRRDQLLPFSTIFIMVTGEATYGTVAEAAESALDGYLLKPHKAAHLVDRLRQARIRKATLQEIFTAIENEDFEFAANLCRNRFASREMFWLYAARVGAELLLRLGRYADARQLYQSVLQARTLPWAKLGIIRSFLDEGQTARAIEALQTLLNEDPNYTDAYDLLGRAQFEQGKFDEALQTYETVSKLTPASLTRLQNLGLVTYYTGDRKGAQPILDRSVRIGIDSKMFDSQTLVLLAFYRLEVGDRKGLQRCQDDFARLIERNPDNARHQRLGALVNILQLIEQNELAQVLAEVSTLCKRIREPGVDFEAASNLLNLLSLMASRRIQMEDPTIVVDTLGLRFTGTRALTELLAGAAAVFPLYAEHIRAANAQLLRLTETAMSKTLEDKPGAAVEELAAHGKETLNSKLIETAYLVLNRYPDKIADFAQWQSTINELRTRYNTQGIRPTLGEQKRQAGGLTLRIGGKPAPTKAEAAGPAK